MTLDYTNSELFMIIISTSIFFCVIIGIAYVNIRRLFSDKELTNKNFQIIGNNISAVNDRLDAVVVNLENIYKNQKAFNDELNNIKEQL
jgi:5-bromo-4-chloroindolyl phosphate hydrolysis protein